MKTRLLFTGAFVILTSAVFAQNTAEMTEDLKRDEVPAAVLTAKKKAMTKSETEGRWELFYLENTTMNSHDAKLTPEFYRYDCKVDGKRMEYFFKPDGKIFKKRGEPSSKK